MSKIFYGWWIVLACFLIAFYVAGVIFYGFTAFIEPLAAEFGWSYTQISFAASLRGLEMGILAPFVGFLVDRFGSRKLLSTGIIFVGFGIILLGRTQSLAMLYAAFLLIAFGAGGCTSVVTMTAVANWFDRNVGKAMGVMASGFGASGLIVPLIVWLISAYGWRSSCLILGFGTWIVGIPLTFVIRDKPEADGHRPDGSESDSAPSEIENRPPAMEIGFKVAMRNWSFLLVNLCEVIRLMSLAAVVTHIMPYMSELGVSRTRSGFLAAALPLLSIIGRFCFGWLGDILEKRSVMAVAYVCMGLGMLFFSYAHVVGTIYLFLLFYSIGFGGIAVLRGAILREYFGRYAFGKLMGVMMGFAAMGGIIGPTLAGWVFDRVGSYHFIWLFFSALIGGAVLLISRVEPRSKVSAAGG